MPRAALFCKCTTLVLGLGAATLLSSSVPATGDGETSAPGPPNDWPWGLPGGDDASGFGRKDWYNLGILGAKASDPARAAQGEIGQGVRQVRMTADPGADRGPDALKVEILFPDGPAAKAGLKSGDVITGVSGRPFKDGSVAPLAKALTDAESTATKGVTLSVERAGSKTSVLVTLRETSKDFATPTRGKARVHIVEKALQWLASKQQEDGGFAVTLSGTNGAVVQTSMAGLAWLAGGSDLTNGRFAPNVKKAVSFVKDNVGKDGGLVDEAPKGGANWNQSNWGLVHAAIFLGELASRSPDADVVAELKKCADEIAKRQETTGGWAMGPGGPNGLGYVELNIVSGMAMLGMGLARGAGWEPPDAVLAKARQYLEDSSGGDGGVGYSTKPGQVGQGNIGRSAVTWMGYAAMGLARDKWTGKMAGYVRQHAGDVFGGHASLMQHFFFAGLASQAMGGEAAKSYWAVAEPNLVLARAPDGTFQPRPWHESLQMGSNSDVTFGQVWTTASWAMVGAAADGQKDGLPGLPAVTGKIAAKPRGK